NKRSVLCGAGFILFNIEGVLEMNFYEKMIEIREIMKKSTQTYGIQTNDDVIFSGFHCRYPQYFSTFLSNNMTYSIQNVTSSITVHMYEEYHPYNVWRPHGRCQNI